MNDSENTSASILSFKSFLEQCKENLSLQCISNPAAQVQQEQRKTIRIILGNEAADLDSIISALALSYLQYRISGSNGSAKMDYIPLIPIPKSDYKLRRDVSLVLELCGGIEEPNLIFTDDEHFQTLLKKIQTETTTTTEVVLVDHNKLTQFRNALSPKVISIIDHHKDELDHASSVIERDVAFQDDAALVASTCTLIGERLIHSRLNLLKIDSSMIFCLIITILIDSINMDPQIAKGTERDTQVLKSLQQQANWNTLLQTLPKDLQQGQDIYWDALFLLVRNAKTEYKFWESLSIFDCCRIDYKMFGSSHDCRFGLSSVIFPLYQLIQKHDFEMQLYEFTKNQNISLLGLLTLDLSSSNDDKKISRDLLLYGQKEIIQCMSHFLLTHSDAAFLNLNRTDFHDYDNNYCWISFQQGNVKASRKQLAPIMLQFWDKFMTDQPQQQKKGNFPSCFESF